MSQYISETICVRIGRSEKYAPFEHRNDRAQAARISCPERRRRFLNRRTWIRRNLAELLNRDPLSVQIVHATGGLPRSG